MTFQECVKLVQSQFSFDVCMTSPQKLCDFRGAFGIIFQAYLKDSDWWGHCDLDQIFGDLSHFITPEMFRDYDKLFTQGHLTLYRNTAENNRMFMYPLGGQERYRQVFTTSEGCGFDEWLPGSINEIYEESGRKVYWDNLGADINSYKTSFVVTYYSREGNVYKNLPQKNSVFQWKNGELHQIYREKDGLKYVEYPYVHLQKRDMKDCRNNPGCESYFMVPNRFTDGGQDPGKLLNKAGLWRFFNYQYFLVKRKSLIYRWKAKDWKMSNVFKT